MKDVQYIDELFPGYNLLELLSDHPTSKVFLAEKEGELFVIKAQHKSCFFLSDPELLLRFSHKGLPKVVSVFSDETEIYYIYEYIHGETLAESFAAGRISSDRAADITIKLCEIVSYLHSFNLIHADIKPENVITNGDNVYLIDFGICHEYSKKTDTATQLIGTDGYIPPELGYRKTDFRADVYALGMVYYFLCTGSANIKEIDSRVDEPRKRRIIKRATSFNVAVRTPTPKHFAENLKKVHLSPVFLPVTVAAMCLAFCVLGIFIGKAISSEPAVIETAAGAAEGTAADTAEEPYEFSDELIEKAIRVSLGKTADEPVYKDDLLTVSGINIVEGEAYATVDEYYERQAELKMRNEAYGHIGNLADLYSCPNIARIYIAYTDLADISVLETLENLTELHLDFDMVKDLSPLLSCQKLDIFSATGMNCENYNFTDKKKMTSVYFDHTDYEKFIHHLDGMTIRDLGVGDCYIPSFDVFPDVTVTNRLEIWNNDITSMDGIERITAPGCTYNISENPVAE
jgi:predicted Ser/Thr protein kinase